MIRSATYMVKVEGYNVRYQVVSEDNKSTGSEPVILVHGLSGSTRWWVRNVESLAQQRCVYLVDLPGFGGMCRAVGGFALAKAASWLLLWMDAVGVERAHFIGHSMGGAICIRLAAQRPDAVLRLVLVAPAVMPHVRSIFGYFIPLLIALRSLKLRFLPILLYDALRAGPLTLLHATQDLLVQDIREQIRAISVPTLLIWGENDTLVPPTLAYVLRAAIPNVRLLVLKRAGHVCMFDQAQEFNRAVNVFLGGETVGE